MAAVIGLFDAGGTRTRVAISVDGQSIDQMRTFAADNSPAGLTAIAEGLEALADGRPLRMVVGGVAGQIDHTSGVLQVASNLTGWIGVAIGRELEQRLNGVPVYLENDVALVGLGEAHHGAGRGQAIVMYETVSTGVNAVRIVDGFIDRSARGFEVGRQLVVGHDGRVTSLEAATGGAALQRRFGRPPAQLASHGLWRSEARLLALGLYNSLLHWSPDVVVLGGAMMRDIKLDDIRTALDQLPAVWPAYPPLIHAGLGDNGGLYGAMVLAQQTLGRHSRER